MLYFLPTCHSLLSFSHFTFARTRTQTLLLFVPLLDSVVVVTGTLVTFVVVVACKRSDKAKSQASKQKPAQVKKKLYLLDPGISFISDTAAAQSIPTATAAAASRTVTATVAATATAAAAAVASLAAVARNSYSPLNFKLNSEQEQQTATIDSCRQQQQQQQQKKQC